MSVLVPPTADLIQMPPEPVRRLTVTEYHQMIAAGILQQDDPFELLEGWLVPKMSRNASHDLVLGLSEDAIGCRLSPEWVRRNQSGVTTSESEPEPDIAVVRGPHRRYANKHPGPEDTGLVVEIAETTLRRDRTTKQRVYARVKSPWIGSSTSSICALKFIPIQVDHKMSQLIDKGKIMAQASPCR